MSRMEISLYFLHRIYRMVYRVAYFFKRENMNMWNTISIMLSVFWCLPQSTGMHKNAVSNRMQI